jgi:peptidoglycan/xylan/chitin deacetylase (PgdA/CDA1 family)
MSIAKQIARKLVYPALMRLGADKWLRARASHNMLNVFYHGVTHEDARGYSPINIPAALFEQQMAYFRREFDIVSLREAFEMYRQGIQPRRKTVTISFDDGYRNNLTTALPILARYDIPATFFLCSVIADPEAPRYLWSDVYYTLRYFYPNETIEVGDCTFKNYKDTVTGIGLSSFIKEIKSASQRDQVLAEIISKYNIAEKIKQVNTDNWQLMNLDELKQFSQSPLVKIGSHGHLHYNLGVIAPSDAEVELKKSKTLLEAIVQKEIDMIAYPDGSYTEEVKNLTQKSGYRYQLAVNYRCHGDDMDTRIIHRYGVSTTTTFESAILNTNHAFTGHGY